VTGVQTCALPIFQVVERLQAAGFARAAQLPLGDQQSAGPAPGPQPLDHRTEESLAEDLLMEVFPAAVEAELLATLRIPADAGQQRHVAGVGLRRQAPHQLWRA